MQGVLVVQGVLVMLVVQVVLLVQVVKVVQVVLLVQVVQYLAAIQLLGAGGIRLSLAESLAGLQAWPQLLHVLGLKECGVKMIKGIVHLKNN